ncbi:hypothetical protein D9M69_692960 [compost metagenome]
MPFTIPMAHSEPLAKALTAVGEVLRAAAEEDEDRRRELKQEAHRAVDALRASILDDDADTGAPSAAESILLSLHRILRVTRAADS